MTYTVSHSEWGEDPYGWQVRKDGEVVDTYESVELAESYADYMNKREKAPQCLRCETEIAVPAGWSQGAAVRRHYWAKHRDVMAPKREGATR